MLIKLLTLTGTALYVFVILGNEVYGVGTRADYHQRNRESMIMVDKRSMYIVKVDNPLP